MRDSQDYAKDKLDILLRFIHMFTTSMKDKPWGALNYIDLLAGPGKNAISKSGEIVLGSPLVALHYPFDKFFFVEKDEKLFESLDARVFASSRSQDVRLFNGDCNVEIAKIIENIHKIEHHAAQGSWQSLNLVFADPEGFEVHWDTIATLGRETRSDLIINFSTSGITRNIVDAFKLQKVHAIDRFLGSRAWRGPYAKLSNRGDGTVVRRFVLDWYAKNLSQLDYCTAAPNGEYIVLNSTNRQLYSLFCASKNQLGIKFFAEAAEKFRSPQLPGFDSM
jgi:three-Cys-motif partner protein